MSLTTKSLTLGAAPARHFEDSRIAINRLFSQDSRVIPELHVLEAIDEDLPSERLFRIKLSLNRGAMRGGEEMQVVIKTNNTDFRFIRKVIRQAFGNGVAIALD